MRAIDTGGPITVPVGPATLGRVLSVIGRPVDKLGDVNAEQRYPIHRHAPAFQDQSTELEMFVTGIKVIDLLEPFLRGGKIGLFGGAGVGKTVLIIAHRFSTIRDASLILVFDRGEVVATGNHAELYQGNPLYRSLYDRQHATV